MCRSSLSSQGVSSLGRRQVIDCAHLSSVIHWS